MLRPSLIPIEIMRTIVSISEKGSLTKAAQELGVSQPAISTQLKKLEGIVGGSLFHKTANGSAPTQLGKLVLAQARLILDANDQVMALGGSIMSGPEPVRIGLSSLIVRRFMENCARETLSNAQIHCDISSTLGKQLVDGHIDLACMLHVGKLPGDVEPFVLERFADDLVWVRSRGFVLSPGMPIPIVTWTNDDWMMRSLTARGVSYRIVFSGQDFDAKRSAVESGVGLTAIPKSLIPDGLVEAAEYYLPALPPIIASICARSGAQRQAIDAIRMAVSSTFRPVTLGDPDEGPRAV